jgi:hypothetical protein
MLRRQFNTSVLAVVFSGGFAAVADAQPATYNGLVRVKSKRLRAVYLKPGADFRVYHKVMIDPTHVAFKKDWKRDYNSTKRGHAGRVTDADMQRAVDRAVGESSNIFAQAFTKGGYAVVTSPGPGVLRVSTALVNITVTAPDIQTAGRSSTFAGEAGQATLVVEARDSVSGELLGAAIDARLAGDNSIGMRRTTVSNRADFQRLIGDWARISVNGLGELKSTSPVNAQGQGRA